MQPLLHKQTPLTQTRGIAAALPGPQGAIQAEGILRLSRAHTRPTLGCEAFTLASRVAVAIVEAFWCTTLASMRKSDAICNSQ